MSYGCVSGEAALAPVVPWCEAPLAPSLRELPSKARLRECPTLDGMPLVLYTPTVGEALSLPLRRSRLGSTSGGAVGFDGTSEPANLTEGVYPVDWNAHPVLPRYCRGRQLGDPKLTQHSAPLNGIRQSLLSSWLPPGGSCHDEISASRNRQFVVTDEGRRWLEVSNFPVKWWKPKHIPFI